MFFWGAYIKLIGVPFRKLYDEQEAVIELKNHRRSAIKLAGWNSLIKILISLLIYFV
uniref:TNase-like domain-containing protein n=1 Tax=Heterorhabditis bacteriophora TaxID=37862 RepID=A0A1I7X295_HETBA